MVCYHGQAFNLQPDWSWPGKISSGRWCLRSLEGWLNTYQVNRSGKNIPDRRRNVNSSRVCSPPDYRNGMFMPPEVRESKDKHVVQWKIRKVSREKRKLFPETMGACKGSGKEHLGWILVRFLMTFWKMSVPAWVWRQEVQLWSCCNYWHQFSPISSLVFYSSRANSLGGGWPTRLYLYSED